MTEVVEAHIQKSSSRFSLRQRLALFAISTLGALVVRLIGCTLRVSTAYEPGANEPRPGPGIYCFWHRCILSATYLFRNMDIGVMTSRSFDGEYIARIIRKFGFIPVRGSSSRGALPGLRAMQRMLEKGHKVAFTIDGPRGPRFVAKPGPILPARNTGIDIIAFYITPERAWVLNTWDRLIVPKPFSRIHVVWSSPIRIRPEGDSTQALAELQAALERTRRKAEAVFPATAV